MPVTATSYKALATQAGITMLAGSATFRTLVGAATATLAKAKIVEEWGGTPALAGGQAKAYASDLSAFTPAPPYAIARCIELITAREGVGIIRYRGSIGLLILQARRVSTETPPESLRRATNVADAIRDEIQAQFAAAGCFAEGVAGINGPTLPDESSADGDGIASEITIDFEG